MSEPVTIPVHVVEADGSERWLDGSSSSAAPPEEAGDEALERQNKLLRDKLKETHQDLLRLQARHAEELEQARVQGQELAVRAVAPALSSIARAAELLGADDPDLRNGLELVVDALERAVEAAGFTRVPDVGARFDPEVHEAVAVESAAAGQDGLVLRTISPGFVQTLDRSRVVLPARVVVARHSD